MLTSLNGIPIAAVVSKANKVEMSTSRRLLRQVERRLTNRQKEGILLRQIAPYLILRAIFYQGYSLMVSGGEGR